MNRSIRLILCVSLCLALASAALVAQDNNQDQSAKAVRERQARAAAQADAQRQAQAAKAKAAADGIKVEVVPGPLNPVEQQFFERLKPLVTVELALAERVCNLDALQRKELEDAGEECAKKAAQQLAGPGQQVIIRGARVGRVAGGGGVAFGGGGFGGGGFVPNGPAGSSPKTARELLDDNIAEVIKAKFSDGASASYSKELDNRRGERKEMIVENIVALIDSKLVLTAEQREAIGKSLLANLPDSQMPQLQILMSDGSGSIPMIPENCLLPHLRDTQRVVWQSLPNRNMQYGFDPFDSSPFGNLAVPAVPPAVINVW
jgi:hypothetical protein